MGQWLFMKVCLTGVWTAVEDGPEHADQDSRRDDGGHSQGGRPSPCSIWTCKKIRKKVSTFYHFFGTQSQVRHQILEFIIKLTIWLLQQLEDKRSFLIYYCSDKKDIFMGNKIFILDLCFCWLMTFLESGDIWVGERVPGTWMFWKWPFLPEKWGLFTKWGHVGLWGHVFKLRWKVVFWGEGEELITITSIKAMPSTTNRCVYLWWTHTGCHCCCGGAACAGQSALWRSTPLPPAGRRRAASSAPLAPCRQPPDSGRKNTGVKRFSALLCAITKLF